MASVEACLAIPLVLCFVIPCRLRKLEKSVRRYKRVFETAPIICLRSRGLGTRTIEAASGVHAVGPAVRASGITEGRRLDHPAHVKLGFLPLTRNGGGNCGRVMVRFQEVMPQFGIIPQCLSWLPFGKVRRGGMCSAARSGTQVKNREESFRMR